MYLGVDEALKIYKTAEEKVDRYNTLMTVLGRAHEHRENAARRAVDRYGNPLPEGLLKQQEVILGRSREALEKLQRLVSKTDQAAKLSASRKIKFTFTNAHQIDKALEEVKLWQDLYQSSFLNLISQDAIPITVPLDDVIDRSKLKIEATYREAFKAKATPTVFIDFSQWKQRGYTTGPILYSAARQAIIGKDRNTLRILDTDESVPIDDQVTDQNARDFAIRLHDAKSKDTGLLRCEGFTKHSNPNSPNAERQISFILYQPPNTSHAMTLRQALLDRPQLPEDSFSRSILYRDRLLMARHLVKAVYGVHLYGYVHKNVRPETILCLEERAHFTELRKDILIMQTARLYRHPDRQRADMPPEYYLMQHDIYSLGVILLEIGYWLSFVRYEADRATPLIRSELLGILEKATPVEIKRRFVELSLNSELANRTSTEYAKVVHNCLTCLDPENAHFSDINRFTDKNRVLERVKYIEEVMEMLNFVALPELPT
ncbi:hypothetical protein SMACR_08200 [Sordaria macrospora]|uniref:WGS project CABT00000000 data, contig 2.43 n=2 Tax=Sordaria macrospora TaxID=5147 RepID=F7W852_SORMK|nr:uncharacterized protein SMAC_08200 [Sordaria macrospora k-hell]KAA8622042.1 hypothetical protein SMACR_08200 [Sordaria macrospora]KAH7632383.1 hypothetical protein B0T09DRAFT_394387 [Sordaria sp. MPI-SDFR-AT-0083]WPJ61118.1 hypothetical protein SMAC4_08200 [Sordaria macrospora]CCC13697.1 unnamed protein product [Sordaria macrospora k-hell]